MIEVEQVFQGLFYIAVLGLLFWYMIYGIVTMHRVQKFIKWIKRELGKGEE